MSARIHVSAKQARTLDGIVFDSKAEMQRYAELRMLERAGLIKDLELQPPYILQDAYLRDGKKIRAITYFADFRYLDMRTKRIVVEDCKGMQTEVYKLKKKILLFKFPEINFQEVKA